MEVNSQVSHTGGLAPEKEPLVPILYEVGWVSEPAWTLWRGEEILPPPPPAEIELRSTSP